MTGLNISTVIDPLSDKVPSVSCHASRVSPQLSEPDLRLKHPCLGSSERSAICASGLQRSAKSSIEFGTKGPSTVKIGKKIAISLPFSVFF